MSQRPAVLFANDAFYTAFATGDLAAMDAVWARRAPVCCIHPGWTAPPATATIRCVRPEVFLLGDAAWVACYEILPNGNLIATNIFVPEDGAWRMVHHHAGPAPPVDAGDEADTPRVQ